MTAGTRRVQNLEIVQISSESQLSSPCRLRILTERPFLEPIHSSVSMIWKTSPGYTILVPQKKHSEELFPSDFIQDNPIASLGPDLLQFLPKYFKETSASQDWPKKTLT